MGVRIGAQQQSEAIQALQDQVSALTNAGPAFSDPISKFVLAQGPDSGHVEIAFRAAAVAGILQIEIHRSLTRDFGTATHLTSFNANAIAPEQDVNYSDINTALVGKTVYYWLLIDPINTNNQPIRHGPQLITVT